MSTQRRRVLEDGKIHGSVYIEGLDGKAYTVGNWQSSYSANSIIVANGDIKFRIALTQPSNMTLCNNSTNNLGFYMTETTYSGTAVSDYDGAGNTENILKVESRTRFAAGYCNGFTFPDGKTKGYLPSLGQLYLAYQNKDAVNAALNKCGGTAMFEDYYWSSTFSNVRDDGKVYFWTISWRDGYCYNGSYLNILYCVRPFANLS